MPIKLIGKSILGKEGFSQIPSKTPPNLYERQLTRINLQFAGKKVIMTSMTGDKKVKLNKGVYVPQICMYDPKIADIFNPAKIYDYCSKGLDDFRPGCDFILWDSKHADIVVTTFSREAPILSFEANNGKKALGVILRPALMRYGDFLFSTIKDYMQDTTITVVLVTCNHYNYSDGGTIPSMIQWLSQKYDMNCRIGVDSQVDCDCFHRGEEGNHVVALW